MLITDLLKGQFPHLPEDRVYADWTGAAVYPIRLVEDWHRKLAEAFRGNPHSSHPSSQRSEEEIEAARGAVLAYLNAPPDEYDVIFTANATAAIELLWHWNWLEGELMLTADNHNSVNGLHGLAMRDQAEFSTVPFGRGMQLNGDVLTDMLASSEMPGPKLFAFPAKSNFSGVCHPLEWVHRAQAQGWEVLLDAAAYMANDRLDLSRVHPEFVCMSFYKMFGFPTGIGCLVVKRSSYEHLERIEFAGGTVQAVGVGQRFVIPNPPGPSLLEDGTPNFNMIGAVLKGIGFLHELEGVKDHAVSIASALHEALSGLQVPNGHVNVHSPPGTDIVTFSLIKDGRPVCPWTFAEEAAEEDIDLRAGCFCNPGAAEEAHEITPGELVKVTQAFPDPRNVDASPARLREIFGEDRAIGSIRASFGYANVPEHAARIAGFVGHHLRS